MAKRNKKTVLLMPANPNFNIYMAMFDNHTGKSFLALRRRAILPSPELHPTKDQQSDKSRRKSRFHRYFRFLFNVRVCIIPICFEYKIIRFQRKNARSRFVHISQNSQGVFDKSTFSTNYFLF